MFPYALTDICHFIKIEHFISNSIYHSIPYGNKKVNTFPAKFLYIQYIMHL